MNGWDVLVLVGALVGLMGGWAIITSWFDSRTTSHCKECGSPVVRVWRVNATYDRRSGLPSTTPERARMCEASIGMKSYQRGGHFGPHHGEDWKIEGEADA